MQVRQVPLRQELGSWMNWAKADCSSDSPGRCSKRRLAGWMSMEWGGAGGISTMDVRCNGGNDSLSMLLFQAPVDKSLHICCANWEYLWELSKGENLSNICS
jgi:hypothetical protein